MENITIVGAGLAGATAAKTLRKEGYGGKIKLIGSDTHRPYNRPPLSKDFLAGETELEAIFVEPEQWYVENDVELLTGETVATLDPTAHRVRLESGTSLDYDAVLLATGSASRHLKIPGADLDGVHLLRTLDDSESLGRALAGGGHRLAVVGSGWIGMEVAATARALGNEVTVFSPDVVPVRRALGTDLGGYVGQLHAAAGVQLRPATTVAEIVAEKGRVVGVLLESGERIDVDVVLLAVGALALTDIAEAAGIAVDNGVLVDAAMRASAPDVFAAGDIASVLHPLTNQRVRSEHWSNARSGGAAAARSMLGQSVSYDGIPSFLTKQYGISMGYSGFAVDDSELTVVDRGDRASGEFIGFRLDEGRVVGTLTVNVRGASAALQDLIRRGEVVDPARLADESIPLEEL